MHDLSQRFEWLSGGLLACEAGRRPLTCEAGSIPPTTSLVFVNLGCWAGLPRGKWTAVVSWKWPTRQRV